MFKKPEKISDYTAAFGSARRKEVVFVGFGPKGTSGAKIIQIGVGGGTGPDSKARPSLHKEFVVYLMDSWKACPAALRSALPVRLAHCTYSLSATPLPPLRPASLFLVRNNGKPHITRRKVAPPTY